MLSEDARDFGEREKGLSGWEGEVGMALFLV